VGQFQTVDPSQQWVSEIVVDNAFNDGARRGRAEGEELALFDADENEYLLDPPVVIASPPA
jgi:hypothetical protein